ncbi:nucleoside hydrolase [Gracilibacillus sp. S3-1-1]|uniref:Nucleoside hydrolase n=1 Tax=Gracilibacillus pellucidus TaxID=3095368 RepID=A0ACC6M3L0_9BACI|nr:nucleoside hydrolase [Gracilibacillus sp. S3-1-1]MDX8045550.1 nucleoside hydrolase [Gracilibacillus sp. S3-1-1]
MTKQIILDVDTGIDDALAITYAAHSPELNLLGITTTFGNTYVDVAARNTLNLLHLLGKDDVPVYKGMSQMLNGDDHHQPATWIHGENGVGNVDMPESPKQPEAIPAHEFIISTVREYPNEVTIITMANHSNLARAIKQDPEIASLIDEVILMGGAVTTEGNITAHAEANIYNDSEAAQFTMQSGVSMTLIGLDVTRKTLLDKATIDTWVENGSPLAEALAGMCQFYMEAYEKEEPILKGCPLHDPLTIGVAVEPSLVETKQMNVNVVTDGEANGQTVGTEDENGNVKVALEVDAEKFVAHFANRILG